MASNEEAVGSYPPIGDYGLIGNCRTSALVSRDGSIDWLCLPRCDSPAFFAALLDAEKGGRFRIRPAGPFSCRRSYISNAPIIETTCRCPGGTVVLRDLFAVGTEEEKEATLTPTRELAGSDLVDREHHRLHSRRFSAPGRDVASPCDTPAHGERGARPDADEAA